MAFFFLCIYTLFLLLRPQDYLSVFAGGPWMIVCLGLALMGTLTRRDFTLRSVPAWSILALFLAMGLSRVFNGWAGGAVLVMKEFAPVLVTFLTYSFLLREPGRLEILSRVLVFSTCIMVIHSVIQSSTGVGWTGAEVVQGNRVTWVGIFNDPNDLAMMLLVAMPMIMMFALNASNKFLMLCWGLVAIAHMYAIHLTGSRGGMLTLMLLFGIMAYRRYGAAKVAMLAMLALPAAFVVVSGMRDISAEEASAAGRVDAWYTGIQLLKQRPLFGVGMGNFTDHHVITAHNSFILVLAELGLVGYFSWTMLIGACALMAWRARQAAARPTETASSEVVATQLGDFGRKPVQSEARGAGRLARQGDMVLYALLAYLSSAFFLSRSYISVLYMVCGMAVAYFHRVQREHETLKEPGTREVMLFMVALIPASLVLLYLVVRVLA